MAVLLGLGAALVYGAADFLGGLASRRSPVLAVVAVSQRAGLAEAIAAGVAFGAFFILVAVLTSLYPASTVLLARALLHERLTPLQVAGLACAGGGVALISAG